MTSVGSSRLLRLGDFEVDLRSGELRKDGSTLRVQPQPFQLLTLLLEHPGELVTRDQIRQRLWPSDTFVDFEHGLNTAMKKLREALGDAAGTPRYIETLPRRGYRLMAGVESLPESCSAPPATPNGVGREPSLEEVSREERVSVAASPAAPGQRLPRRRLWLGLAVGAALALAAAYWAVVTSKSRIPATLDPIASLAVLPLENLSGKPAQEYLADGLTDALITDLSQMSTLRVVSRTSDAVQGRQSAPASNRSPA